MHTPVVCTPKRRPAFDKAAETATTINLVNRASWTLRRGMLAPLSVVYWKQWGAKGVRLTVGFLDSPPAALRNRILMHMNAWAKTANVRFVSADTDPQVRIARVPKDGSWSYIGTDILRIERDQPTMNLDSFTMETPESEYKRIVRHETGHTLGFPHEHLRKELVAKIDEAKAIEYFNLTQGWSAAEVWAQVLTPLEEGSLLGSASVDSRSIMCYQIPGEITKDGKPILGGTDIDKWDRQFASRIYPKPKV